MILAAVGFVLSMSAHLLAVFGIAIPGGGWVWGLHVGIFVVFLPAVVVSSQASRFGNRRDFWKLALAGCPPWMRYALYGLFAYAVINFVFFATNASQHAAPGSTAPPSVIRGFSGHWMAFYAAAFTILYSRIQAPELFLKRHCASGHLVAPTARFCPECGQAVPPVIRED
jgi:hypothetical protein